MSARPAVHLGAGFWVWFGLVLGGLAVIAVTGMVLLGGLVMAAGFAFAAASRVALGGDAVAGIHVRGRRIDVVMHALFALAIAVAALLVHLREGT